MKRLVLVLLLLLLAACGKSKAPAFKPADAAAKQLSERVYVLHGANELPNPQNRGFMNNPAFVIAGKGVVVIDPGSSRQVGDLLLAKIAEVTPLPVIAVFNTHIHGDHWLGNDAIKRAYPKAVIYGHPNMKAAREAGEGERWVKVMDRETQGETAGTVAVGPDKAVNHGEVIKIGDRQFRIHHFGSTHTDNDILIEVVEDKVLFVGDIVRVKALDIRRGSFKANIAAIEKVLSLPVKIFVPGHGSAGGREILDTYNGFLRKLYATVQKLYKLGISDSEMKPKVIEALKEYRNWADFDTLIGRHVSQAYLEVEKELF